MIGSIWYIGYIDFVFDVFWKKFDWGFMFLVSDVEEGI